MMSALDFERDALPCKSSVGRRFAFEERSKARAWSTRAAATATSVLYAKASSMSSFSTGSPNKVHHGSGSCTVSRSTAGRLSGSGRSGFCGSTRETMQPLRVAATAIVIKACLIMSYLVREFLLKTLR
jgi:hypothetical protein